MGKFRKPLLEKGIIKSHYVLITRPAIYLRCRPKYHKKTRWLMVQNHQKDLYQFSSKVDKKNVYVWIFNLSRKQSNRRVCKMAVSRIFAGACRKVILVRSRVRMTKIIILSHLYIFFLNQWKFSILYNNIFSYKALKIFILWDNDSLSKKSRFFINFPKNGQITLVI